MPTEPQNPQPEDPWRTYANQVLRGEYLHENPYLTRAVIDPARRESEETYARERGRLNQAAGAAGRFGGDWWSTLQRGAYEQHQEGLDDLASQALFANYSQERGLQNAALGTMAGYTSAQELGQLDAETRRMLGELSSQTQLDLGQLSSQTQLELGHLDADVRRELAAQQIQAQANAAAAQRASAANAAQNQLRIAELQAQLQRDLQAEQLGFSREELETMDALQRYVNEGQWGLQGAIAFGDQELANAQLLADLSVQQGQQQLGALNLLGQLGLGYNDQMLQAYSLVPGLEQAGYTGLGIAGQLAGQVGAADAAAANSQHADDLAAWQYQWEGQQQALEDLLGIVGLIGGLGGTSDTHGLSAPGAVPAAPDPWAAGISGALGGLLSGVGLFGGLGGGNPPADPYAPPADGVGPPLPPGWGQ